MTCSLLLLFLFKAWALWADAFYKSKCLSACPCVCLSVCLFTFEVPFNCLFAPHFPKSDVQYFEKTIPEGWMLKGHLPSVQRG